MSSETQTQTRTAYVNTDVDGGCSYSSKNDDGTRNRAYRGETRNGKPVIKVVSPALNGGEAFLLSPSKFASEGENRPQHFGEEAVAWEDETQSGIPTLRIVEQLPEGSTDKPAAIKVFLDRPFEAASDDSDDSEE